MSDQPKDLTVTCGKCGIVYQDNDAYLKHVCSVTGYNPTQPEHQGEQFIMQSKAALKRTGSLTPEREAELDVKLGVLKKAKKVKVQK